jgi:hypothetical protein
VNEYSWVNSLKKLFIFVLVMLVGSLLAISVVGCQEPFAQGLGQNVPSRETPEIELSRQVEFHGVTLSVPAEWKIILPEEKEYTWIRLSHPGSRAGEGPWIELSQALKPVDSDGSVPAVSTTAGDGILTFSQNAVGSDGSSVHHIYIPSKNVMVKAGCKNSSEYNMITNILATIQISS